MKYFYSKTNAGFYISGIHSVIPDDSVEITAEKYTELVEGQSNGRIITTDENGYPVLIDREASQGRGNEKTFKTDVWLRSTEEEAEIIDGALTVQPVRMRRMWDDCQSIEHDSEMFATLQAQMNQVFGEERTAELLAPSEGA